MTVTVVLLAGTFAAFLGIWWWQRRSAEGSLYTITNWPLQAREVITTEERTVWHWLSQAFEGHQILLKTPLTCFTAASCKKHSHYWHPLLRGTYCTFSVCSADGYVIGCIDVLKETRRLPVSHRKFRQALLSRCSIAYMALEPDYLPSVEAIRLNFLGNPPTAVDISIKRESCLGAARRKLHDALARRRRSLHGVPTSLAPIAGFDTFYLAEEGQPERAVYVSDWQKYDSFIAPLNRR